VQSELNALHGDYAQIVKGVAREAQVVYLPLYEAFRAQGVLPATHEVVFGHAWGHAGRSRRRRGGPYAIPVGSIGRRDPR
jgi:hypothetical protein